MYYSLDFGYQATRLNRYFQAIFVAPLATFRRPARVMGLLAGGERTLPWRRPEHPAQRSNTIIARGVYHFLNGVVFFAAKHSMR
jgi:hypothetical protein